MAKILYFKVEDSLSKEEKFKFLNNSENVFNVDFKELTPNKDNVWITEGLESDWEYLIPLGTKEAKQLSVVGSQLPVIFKLYSLGVSTNRDAWVYNCSKETIKNNVNKTIKEFNRNLFERSLNANDDIEKLIEYNDELISWSSTLKNKLRQGININYNTKDLRLSIYRPFFKNFLFFNRDLIDRCGQFHKIFPTTDSEKENMVICVPSHGGRLPFWCFISNKIVNLALTSIDANQCFPFYTYNEDGTGRKENISDWALSEFSTNYKDENITKIAIFYYIYAILHKPEYREKYAANLRRSLPRIPMLGLKDIKQSSAASDAELFWKYSEAGKKLADLHLNYEEQPEYPLTKIESEGMQLDWRVDKMKYVKSDDGRLAIKYNDFLTLAGIPAEVKEYKLGNRSALDWIIDQYRVKTDKRSGITNDPFRADEPDYIVRLIGKIVTVSLETMKIVRGL
ncbi:MAG: helicase [Ignavibacteria bacterium]|nr:helicase [Ignavibacteria bacterium]